jgi:YD repeat-containing protein
VLKRFAIGLFFCFAAQFVMVAASHAQSPPGCLYTTIWYFPDPVPAGFTILGPAQGPFSIIISSPTYLCLPPYVPCPKCLAAGQPIALSSGNTFIEENDVKIPGLGGGLSLTRTWNSAQRPQDQLVQNTSGQPPPYNIVPVSPGIFSGNWRSTYEERVYLGSDGYLTYLRSDGSYWAFGIDPSSSVFRVAAPSNISATFNSGTITFQNGEQRRFDSVTGNLVAIVDRNGNTTTISYDSHGRLSTVTDAAGRSLTFTYQNPSATVVSGLTSSVGISLSFTYTSGLLTQVTEQDLSTLNFTYGPQNMITQVTDSQGKVIETHTYDSSGRGLTSAKANGVDAVTVVYP